MEMRCPQIIFRVVFSSALLRREQVALHLYTSLLQLEQIIVIIIIVAASVQIEILLRTWSLMWPLINGQPLMR